MMVAWLLNSWLQYLIKIKRVFPIEIKTEGRGVVIDACRHPAGLVICSIHMPLVHVVLHSLIDIGVPPAGVVAGKSEMEHGKIPVWGLQQDLPGILVNGLVLVKMRSILRHGGVVFALVDVGTGAPPRDNIFRLIRKSGARAVLAIPVLRPSGEIAVEYFDPPDPFCTSEESIAANLDFLRAKVKSIISGA
jgi:hypothetical protein